MLKDFDALFAVTKDEQFGTYRKKYAALWRMG